MSLIGSSSLFRGEGLINAEVRRVMSAGLARNWWAVAIRGSAALVFGLIAVTVPRVTILSLVIAFSAYSFVDGSMGVVSAARAAREGASWSFPGAAGLISVLASGIALAWPGLTVLVFVVLIASREIVGGALMMISSMQLDDDHGRGWLALSGLLSFLFGSLLVFAPFVAALIFAWWLGVYALAIGASLLLFAIRLRARHHERPHGSFA